MDHDDALASALKGFTDDPTENVSVEESTAEGIVQDLRRFLREPEALEPIEEELGRRDQARPLRSFDSPERAGSLKMTNEIATPAQDDCQEEEGGQEAGDDNTDEEDVF